MCHQNRWCPASTHTPFSLPIPNVLCQTFRMRKLSATLCLTIVVLLGSAGVSWGADFQKGLTAYERGDYATALREWTPLAEQGVADAQYNLGVMYGNGKGVPKDYETAVKWYRLAAKQGHASAQFNLGVMYGKGQGVSQDYKTALKWYRLASEQGDAFAQSNLGQMYHQGKGVSQDYKTALKWYRLASEQGDTHMWVNIAASIGGKDSDRVSDFVEKKMTPAQIAEAQKLARECVRKKYKGC